jgi:hypothetical protein
MHAFLDSTRWAKDTSRLGFLELKVGRDNPLVKYPAPW